MMVTVNHIVTFHEHNDCITKTYTIIYRTYRTVRLFFQTVILKCLCHWLYLMHLKHILILWKVSVVDWQNG